MAKYGIVVNRWGGWLVAGWLVAGWLVGCDIINWLGTRTGARSGARSPGVLVPSRALEGRVGCAFPNDLLRLAEVWTEGLGARGTKEGR